MSVIKNSTHPCEPVFQRAAHRFQDALAALAAGAGAVPFGDNGRLFRDLAELRRQRALRLRRDC